MLQVKLCENARSLMKMLKMRLLMIQMLFLMSNYLEKAVSQVFRVFCFEITDSFDQSESGPCSRLHRCLNNQHSNPSEEIPLSTTLSHSELSFREALEASYLEIDGNISTFNSAIATFRAPSDTSGIYGMRREHIRATTSWRGGPAVRLHSVNSDQMLKEHVVSKSHAVSIFFISSIEARRIMCFSPMYSYMGEEPDEDTGF